ncbi:MAG: hypothetical protein EBQ96_08830 [Proteobacteria bacterium]|nr:hypothetical protein [Pseudomonadota bacterium]
MKTKYLLTVAALALLVPIVSHAQDDTAPKWNPHIEAEGKWGTDRSLGEVGAFIPVWQDDDSLLFGNFIGRLDDQDSREGNIGIGYRQQVSDDWAVGGYGFYDRRKTETGNHFNQATIGAEAFRDNMEFRVNGYIPESEEKTIAGSGGGTTISGSATGGNLQIVTTTTGAQLERALPGFDAEAGYKFNLPNNWEAWAYIGGYRFEADGYEDVTGPRGRVEVSYKDIPVLGEGSRFTVGLESQNDDVRDTQHFGIARLRIPLNVSTTKTKPTLSALDERMTTRIVRDVDVVAGSPSAPPSSTSTTETARATLDSGATVTTYTTINASTANVVAAVDGAGDNALILFDGTGGIINTANRVEMRDGQTIIGGGRTITLTGTTSGTTRTATMPGTRGTVNGTNGGVDVFQLSGDDDVTFDGINISGGRIAIAADSTLTSNLAIRNVNISNTPGGVIYGNNLANVQVSNVTMNNVATNVGAAVVSTIGYINGISFNNVTVNTARSIINSGIMIGIDNASGSITATNITGVICDNTGIMGGSTLTINSVACP